MFLNNPKLQCLMTIIGFNFIKISGERINAPTGKIEINNNATIKSVEKADFTMGKTKQAGIRFLFEFTSKYVPNIAEILMAGEVLYLSDPKQSAELVKRWAAEKKLEGDIMTEVLNTIMNKCNIEALILSRDLNLPPPVHLPRISPAPVADKKDYIG